MRRGAIRTSGFAVVALTVAACTASAPDATPAPAPVEAEAVAARQGGTVTVAVDQEPATFNPRTLRGNTTATRDIVRSVLPAAWSVNDRHEFVLNTDLLASAEVTAADPQTIVYRIRPEAVWSDGVAVSADDFIHAFEVQSPGTTDIDGKPLSVIAPNEDVIASVTGSDGGRTVTVVLKQPFADWQALYLAPLVPAHRARQVGWNAGFDDGPSVLSAGPFRIASHNRGKDLTLVRNERYWGTAARLDSIVFRFVSQSTDTVAALKNGDVDLITPRIQVDLKAQLAGVAGVRAEAVASQTSEYLDFKVSHPQLAKREVRQAFALAVDRPAIVARTVAQLDPAARVLNHRLYFPSQSQYQDTSAGRYDRPDVPRARQLLEGAGFTAGADGIYVAPDGARLSLELTTTSGDALREAQTELIAAQVRPAGIEVTPAAVAPGGALAAKLGAAPSADPAAPKPFEVVNIGQNLAFASSGAAVFGTGGSANVAGYANPVVDDLFTKARAELDAGRRAAIYHDIDRLLWADMVRLPLYQRPGFVAYRSNVLNVAPSPALGPYWNTARWGLAA